MKIYSVYDKEFKPYGKVIEGYDTAELIDAMNKIELPESGVAYEPFIESLEDCAIFGELSDRAYGGMPVELGMCWGRNTKLNCLEYHKDSEINIGAGDFVLLLALMSDIEDGKLDTGKVKAFRAPAGVAVEVYETALHYAPCHVDAMLWARNKWLLAHPESAEAADGAYIGLTGENIDIA